MTLVKIILRFPRFWPAERVKAAIRFPNGTRQPSFFMGREINAMTNSASSERQLNAGNHHLLWGNGGVSLWTLDFDPGGTPWRREIFPTRTARLVFCLKGAFTLSMLSPNAPPDCHLSIGRGALLYYPELCNGYTVVTNGPAQGLSVYLVGGLPAFLGDVGLEGKLQAAIRENHPLKLIQPIDHSINRCLQQVVDILASDTGGSLFLLSRLTELAWQFSGRSQVFKSACNCCKDHQTVEMACKLLASNLTDPPSLKHLASEVGVSVSKLKLLFQQVCGIPPFGYLRRLRMERARELLVHRRMNVTEAAYEVGYASLSHFSKAFTDRYGISPSQVRAGREGKGMAVRSPTAT